MSSIGPQYEHDDHFKAAARLHQSAYRAKVLKVGFDQYGNRLYVPHQGTIPGGVL